ncbi:MAG: hypothetical protein GF411_06080 [Candidatus Lokiarchaeota archaeon]|nr:hypothetical protein [Candidatus Lokiarchaeota archaeon]
MKFDDILEGIMILRDMVSKTNMEYQECPRDVRNMINGSLKELELHLLQRVIPGAYCTDLDFILYGFEDGELIIRAIIEIKNGGSIKENQMIIYRKISEALDVPFYVLEALSDLTRFRITDNDSKIIDNMSFEELSEFFQVLVSGNTYDRKYSEMEDFI